jgi:hypothetical protein
MAFTLSPLVLLLIAVTLANLFLAFVVIRRKPHAEVNRVFALTAMAVAGWTFTNTLFQATASVRTATQAAAFSYLSAIVLGASFLHFAWIFPRRSTISLQAKMFLWFLACAIGLVGFVPNTVIRAVEITSQRAIITGPGLYLIALFMVSSSTWAFGRLLRQHRQLLGVAREQSRYVLAGASLTAIIGLICNLFLPLTGNYALVWLGPASSVFFVGFTVYAIVATHLFDIRIIIKRTLVYAILLAGISIGYGMVEDLLKELLRGVVGGIRHPLLADLGSVLIISLLVAPARDKLEKWLDHLLFGRRQRHRPVHAR